LGKLLKTIVTGAGFSFFLSCLGCGSNSQPAATQQSAATSTPSITQVFPQTIPAGSQAMTLKVTGTNFPSRAAILWNGTPIATTVVDANTLSSTIGSSSLVTPAAVQLKVQNRQTMQESSAAQVVITDPNAAPASALTLSIATLPQGVVGASYSGSFSVSGGTSPYTWNVASGQLPPGLSVAAATGVISGTPTSAGNYSFAIQVTDSGSSVQSATTTVNLPVATPPPAAAPALTITSSSLPSGTIGAAYSASLQLSGGTAPYAWSITSGGLPNGLSLSATTGVISGTPTGSGTTNLTATIADSSNPSQTKSVPLTLVIAPLPLVITTSSLPPGTSGATYSNLLQASGGTGPYNWTIASGSLPTGVSLAPTGVITGTPAASGTFNFTAMAADASNPAQTKPVSLSIVIVAAGSPLAISTTSLSAGVTNASYSSSLNATGGTPPYTWSWSIANGSSSLPAGLTFATSTGTISGTPTAISTTNLIFTVTDSSSPVQVKSTTLPLAISAPALTITGSALPSGTNGTAYSSPPLAATGGTPTYTWSLATGSSLPAGLTLAASTGIISGTPSVNGTFNFTVTVSDNGTPIPQTASTATSIVVAAAAPPPGPGTTWFVRPDGGTRYSSNVTTGQCDGMADVAYSGTGINQHCAFNDVRYLWQDGSYATGASFPGWGWVIAGGDTVVIRGGPWRIGWPSNTNSCGTGGCFGIVGDPYNSGAPNPPSGTASAHTRILGENYAACSTGNAPNLSALTQLFGGFAVGATVSMGSAYVDFQCIEITDHSSCTKSGGMNAYPSGCVTSTPLDDFASNGIQTGTGTSNVLFQDVYVHGLPESGFFGPIGGPVTLNRVLVNFNSFAGWNFDDGADTPDLAGSSITANYVTMVGNGCNEEYPIVHTGYPAAACYDLSSGGFGDSWSGQDTVLDSFTCNHCDQHWNTKDGFIGPHTFIKNLTITQSTSYGNMGQQWKWNTTTNSTVTFTNNFAGGNCYRMSQAIPGAAYNFWEPAGNPGGFLTAACRASGDTFNVQTDAGSTNLFAGNTIMGASNVAVDFGCAHPNACTGVPIIFTDNVFIGYFDNNYTSHLPTPYYTTAQNYGGTPETSLTVSSDHNLYYNINGPCPTGVGELCTSPVFVNQPASPFSTESDLDAFDFYPASNSPLIGAGAAVSGLTVDYYGATRPNPPSIGAAAPLP
jgi:hypothetical protein